MRVLVGCESSGIVRQAFRHAGHDAYSCDLVPAADNQTFHLRCDVRDAIRRDSWDLLIAHPPCTYLCRSSVWALHRTSANPTPGILYSDARWSAMRDAATFFRDLLDAPIPRIAVENPVPHGYARTLIGPYQQLIQPYQFGDDASKATCLWLKGLPPLISTRLAFPRLVNGQPRWQNQTDSGQNKLGPSNRSARRSQTFPGIADAMAQQWS